MTAAHYKGGHPPGNDLGLHYTALPPIVASCPYSDQLLVTRKFWSPGANRPSQVSRLRLRRFGFRWSPAPWSDDNPSKDAPISLDLHGYKLVAVGPELHWSKDWKRFPT